MYQRKSKQEYLFSNNTFPSTRYQGSKRKLIDWIYDELGDYKYDTVFDPFGGTGVVSYKFKLEEKKVVYNDILTFNYIIGKSIIENNNIQINKEDVNLILTKHNKFDYKNIIQKNFQDIYFTDEENIWLDVVIQNIYRLKNKYKQSLAFNALFQSCMIKRPFNLFHRKNLYMRIKNIERSFGNKTTWDKPFEEHFLDFISELNCCIFDNGRDNKAINEDVFNVDLWNYDLVYIDTPYINSKEKGINYRFFYHFLEGITDYYNWENKIDYSVKTNRLKKRYNIWNDPKNIKKAYKLLFGKIRSPITAISYRTDGIPSKEWFISELNKYYHEVTVNIYGDYQYVLSNNNSKEMLIIATKRKDDKF